MKKNTKKRLSQISTMILKTSHHNSQKNTVCLLLFFYLIN